MVNLKFFVIFKIYIVDIMKAFFLLKNRLIVTFNLLNLFILKAFKRYKNSFLFTALANRLQSDVGFNSGIYAINLYLENVGMKLINRSIFFNKSGIILQLRLNKTAIHEK